MNFQKGEVHLVDLEPTRGGEMQKVRPAVIVSANPQEEDVIIAFISSVVPKTLEETEFLLTSESPEFSVTGLKKNSVFKLRKLLTVSSTLILRRLGHIGPNTRKELDKLLKKALNLS